MWLLGYLFVNMLRTTVGNSGQSTNDTIRHSRSFSHKLKGAYRYLCVDIVARKPSSQTIAFAIPPASLVTIKDTNDLASSEAETRYFGGGRIEVVHSLDIKDLVIAPVNIIVIIGGGLALATTRDGAGGRGARARRRVSRTARV